MPSAWPRALLPALGAVLVLVGDAVLPGRRSWQPLLGVVVLAIAAGTALAVGLRAADDPVRTLCLPGPQGACLWTAGPTTGTLQAGILLATAAALALLHDGGARPARHDRDDHLLLAAATGGVGVAGLARPRHLAGHPRAGHACRSSRWSRCRGTRTASARRAHPARHVGDVVRHCSCSGRRCGYAATG